MNVNYFIFIWLVMWAFLENVISVTSPEMVCGVKIRRWKIGFAIVLFLPVFLLASLGDPISDTVLYLKLYENLPITFDEVVNELKTIESGHAFTFFGFVIKSLFNSSKIVYRLFLALVHSIPIILVYRKYSDDYWLSIYLFVASACHIGWMMNGLRQFVAVVIIFAATPFIIEKKNIHLIIVILIATLFHTSAIIMLPVVFIVQGQAWNKKIFVFILAALIATYVFNYDVSLFDSLLMGTEYEGISSTWRALGDDGVNPIRVLVNAIPMILAYWGRNIINDDNNPVINICVNMSIVTVGLYLIAMVTSGVTVGRIPIYTSLYNFILLPYLVERMFTKDSAKVMKLLMVILYFAYYLYET